MRTLRRYFTFVKLTLAPPSPQGPVLLLDLAHVARRVANDRGLEALAELAPDPDQPFDVGRALHRHLHVLVPGLGDPVLQAAVRHHRSRDAADEGWPAYADHRHAHHQPFHRR